MKKQLKTISLKEFTKDFTPEQLQMVEDEIKYYNLLTTFKKAREEKGMTQEELAQKAKINRTTLSRIESGIRNATIGTLEKLATALDLKLDVTLRVA